MKRTAINEMPQFVDNLGQIIGEASPYLHSPEVKPFLDAFIGNRIQKTDEGGTLTISPLTGDVNFTSPGGFGLSASPTQKRVEGRFRFGGPDRSLVGRPPEAALDEALGIAPPVMEEAAPRDWQDLWRLRNPNYQ